MEIDVKTQHLNKKPLSRKLIFVQTPFSHCTLKKYPADCREIAAVDTHDKIGNERRERTNEKIIFVHKQF